MANEYAGSVMPLLPRSASVGSVDRVRVIMIVVSAGCGHVGADCRKRIQQLFDVNHSEAKPDFNTKPLMTN
jgi:hypothetical protein